MNQLEMILEAAPILSKLLYEADIMIAITDREKFVYYSKSKTLDAQVKIGQPVLDYDALGLARDTGKVAVVVAPPEYGHPFRSVGIPLFDNQKIVGMMGIGASLEQEFALGSLAETLSASLQQIAASVNEVNSMAQKLATTQENMNHTAEQTKKNTDESGKIVDVIRNVSKQTNLLGLNAGIIAAKAQNEEGRSFQVVAKEVRNLSTNTSEAIGQIEEILEQMKKSSTELQQLSQSMTPIITSQASATTEINVALEQLNIVAQQVLETAQKLQK
ncbi:methyl-accepting chemotaxis protein (MCP) signaling protein [Aneurinibacillus soli]|uniref:Putative sensory transducer protein YfmS n=1 Tax=Aneurinibacillus soli TaxID=1500254 RepID=A0A0U5B5U0_9BACL|nr:methyl-accepting chemotaxis protein [Aneurinibacillus soli]PYE61233.1 methyl-accepting chemotaxis protein (MCP) signaling protein [Aneurinibacillus soli]BAU26332.1 putative sensory transducer protein YfmS [Aneurinibacillus soli]